LVGRRTLSRRLAVLVVSAALLAAGLAVSRSAAAPGADGGTLTVASTEDVDSLDPALAFFVSSWAIEYSTCAPLMLYPDTSAPAGSSPVPEAAAGPPTISRGGRTYVFTVRPGLRFSDGSPLTAANFAAAIKRVIDPVMNSGGSYLLANLASVSARGRTLRLVLKQPEGDLVEVLALPFFCPVPANFPTNPAGTDLTVGSGPYYVASRVPNREIVLKRNRFYSGRRPHHPAVIDIQIGATAADQLASAEAGKLDVPFDAQFSNFTDAELTNLVRRYGLGKGQFFLKPFGETFYLALNTQRAIFKNNVPLRQAINFAVDRHEIVRELGLLEHRRTDQLLPFTANGFTDAHIYPLSGSNLKRARALARGHLRSGHVVFYSRPTPFWQKITAVVKYNLEQLGLTVDVKSYPSNVMNAKAGTRGEPFDIAMAYWTGDTPDPADFVHTLLSGDTIRATGNTNISYFDIPAYNRRIRAANALVGASRYRAYGRLEVDIMKNEAPVVPLFAGLAKPFVSARVGCFTYNPFLGFDFAALCVR
jgi:peptide/nickel transport system substrate-binding protein